jgi:Domain of unknown function (DUF4287)/Domain of unknown function (DUF5655)
MAKSPEDGLATLIRNLEEKTGKSIDAWAAIARASGKTKHKEIVDFIKSEHGLGHGYANQIAFRALAAADAPAAGSDDLVEAQYSGPKAAVRPVYEALVKVSLRRSKQFGLIQPTTAARVDVGIVLKEVSPTGRLEASGSFNAMVTHRVRVANVSEVDAELIGWLRQAYDKA